MRSMILSPILCAGLACAMFTLVARATAAPDDGHRIEAERTGDLESPRNGARPRAGSQGRNSAAASPRRAPETPQRGVRQGAGGSTERLHSPLNTQAGGHLARQPSRPMGSIHGATGSLGVRGPIGAGAAGAPKPAASKPGASPLPKLTAMPKNSALGAPRFPSVGRLGGAVIGRTNHSPAIDGTEFRRKF